MSGNPLPWIVLAAIVAATLVMKGYVKFPSGRPAFPSAASTVQSVASSPTVDVDALAKLGSFSLGLAFAKAVRAEAESTLAHTIARQAGESIHATFTAPFSPPAPAGQPPLQAGDQRPL